MQIFLEHIINGITLGSLYASVAIGLTLIFGVVQMVNFSQGDFLMVASYAFLLAHAVVGIPYPIASIIVIAVMAVFGLVFEGMVVRPVFEKPWYLQLITTLAASTILKEIARLIWGSTPKATPTPYVRRFVEFGDFHISYQRILVFVVIVLAFWALNRFFQKTKLGKAMRAVAQNREACSILGIDVRKVYRITFALACALAALGAVLVTPLYNVFPDMGGSLIIRAFAAVVAGGFGQVSGAIIAAFVLGIVEALGMGYISSAYKDAIAFSSMILILIIRPQGIFGRKKGRI
jgi:branched-chain amino acid transport system permease protein